MTITSQIHFLQNRNKIGNNINVNVGKIEKKNSYIAV